ncbi:hypothetical protein GGI25_002679 [Coemansia spiralis]|uniref:PCI domain-containing protein n=2 Tax=Coemansia TaxID=4863 RepID=A0A9W8G3H5_9FUNG|nr:26S proteasome subunit RPN7-domain-containing protein [Coemansia spiralis]KAJ1992883.1 hypothetical protein EDC05_002515 [Coemansia umbellata]KAJ2622818.1 hypothetical protein GGI26_002925 [Coemansia sp. RSA 1358]KAJ2678036.1 hypothetical protein GGI25_002679 [Coemansia spiralis]
MADSTFASSSKRPRMSSVSSTKNPMEGFFTFADEQAIKITVYPKPTLDNFSLSEYLAEYKGMVKAKRAIHMGERCEELAQECYLIALDELEASTYNTRLHGEVCKRLEQLDVALPDKTEWKRGADQKAKREISELHKRITETKSGNLLVACRDAHKELAELYAKMGNTEEALRVLQNGREFCGGAKEHGDLHFCAAEVTQTAFRWLQTSTFVQRAFSSLAAKQGKTWIHGNVLLVQAGFGDSRWSDVARSLSDLDITESDAAAVFELGTVTAKDLALYATLAALIAFKRNEIKEKLINNLRFGKFFESMPECLALLKDHHNSKYTNMIAGLDKILSFCVLDPVIGPHASKIRSLIIENTVVLYSQPYVSANLETMARALRFDSVSSLEKVLVKLITSKRISARIDNVAGYLFKYKVDPRDEALQSIEKMYKTFNTQVDVMKARIQFLEEESGRGSIGSRSVRGR